MLAVLLARRDQEAGVVLATRLPDGRQHVLPDPHLPDVLRQEAARALVSDQPGLVTVGSEQWFLQVHAPSYRLVIVGAVHIAQTLAPLAAMMGMAPTIIDPRTGFATAERFPGVTLIRAWPDEALAQLNPGRRTAVVALSHDPKLDDPALDAALRSDAFFVGALGSRKTHAARLERLAAQHHAPDTLARIRGPVGLAVGAITAPEIAMSILAEIIAVRRGSTLAIR